MYRKDKRQSNVGSKKKLEKTIKKRMTVKNQSNIKNIVIKSVRMCMCVCV